MAKRDILIIAGARPNFMKISPILRALSKSSNLNGRLIHTGQHYDEEMSGRFFKELGIPEPEINLNVAKGSQSFQTADIMQKFETVLESVKPVAILVVGDVTSTLACALVAVKNGCPVIHVEAGLRSFDRKMPEEINRVLTDQISDILFTTEYEANENLFREGISKEKIHFVGNVMVDSLDYNLEQAITSGQVFNENNISFSSEDAYGVLTLHRPSNVDDHKVLSELLNQIAKISNHMPIIFPAHPRTKAAIEDMGLNYLIEGSHIEITPPLSYLSMLGLMKSAALVMTDSGGLQEETTALGVPCFTLRENTERWITVTQGTNTMVGVAIGALEKAFEDYQTGNVKKGARPTLWDGKASERIVAILEHIYSGK